MAPAIDLAAMTEAEKGALVVSLLPQLRDALTEIAVLKLAPTS